MLMAGSVDLFTLQEKRSKEKHPFGSSPPILSLCNTLQGDLQERGLNAIVLPPKEEKRHVSKMARVIVSLSLSPIRAQMRSHV